MEYHEELKLATIASLRTEIQSRSSAQHTLMSMNLTAAAALAGVALVRNGDIDVLLVLPPVSLVLGVLYLDHAYAIGRIRQRIVVLCSYRELLGLEGEDRVSGWFSIPIMLVFGLLPSIALVALAPNVGSSVSMGKWMLWILGCVSLVTFVVSAVKILRIGKQKDSK